MLFCVADVPSLLMRKMDDKVKTKTR